jgi:hypothetical protein
MNILVSLDGVLSSESGEPIRAGVALYYALNINNRVALMTSRGEEDAKHWLQSHGIINYDDLIDNSFALEGEDLKKRQFVVSRSRAPIEMYVDSDPTMCAWVFEQQRVPALLFSHPGFAIVENRPDAPKKVRRWSDIEASITRVNISRSEQAQKPKEAELWSD